MNTLTKMTTTQFKLYLREPVALFFSLLFPVLLLLLFGVIFGNRPGFIKGTPYGYIDLQVPALAALVVGTVAFMSIPVATANSREQKILRRYKITPLNPAIYIAADVIVNFLVAAIGMVLLVIVAKLAFGLRFAGNPLFVIAGFALSALAFIAAGYVIASIAPSPRVAQVAGQVIFFPMMFLSGAALPLSIMPEGVQQAAQWLPMTHMVKLLQDLWYGVGWNMTSLAVIAGVLVVGFVVSTQIFRWE